MKKLLILFLVCFAFSFDGVGQTRLSSGSQYIIVTELASNERIQDKNIPKALTMYEFDGNYVTVKDRLTGEIYINRVIFSDLVNGDDSDNVFTLNTLETFLLANTGFNRAGLSALTTLTWLPVPTLSSPNTIDFPTTGESVELGELGGSKDIQITEDWIARLRPNGWNTGTLEELFRFDANWNTIGGVSSTGGQVFDMQNGSPRTNHVWLFNAFIQGVAGSTSGTKFFPSISGSYLWIRNTISYNMGFANYQVNDFISGGYYRLLDFRFVGGVGLTTEGEAFYLGDTDKTSGTYSVIRNLRIRHGFGINKGRDGLQLGSVVPIDNTDKGLEVNNVTIAFVGQEDVVGHSFLLQAQNVNGYIENSLFHDAPQIGIIAAHDFRIENTIFSIKDDHARLLIQDLEDNSGYDAPEAANNQDQVYEDVIFRVEGSYSTNALIEIEEDDCNVVFNDPIFYYDASNYTFVPSTSLANDLIDDQRTDKVTYSITVNNPTYLDISQFPEPAFTPETYLAFDEANAEEYGKIATKQIHDLGIGYGTPELTTRPPDLILDSETVSDVEGKAILITSETGGTIYVVATTSTTKPTFTQVKAGQDHTGSAAPNANSSITDFQLNINVTGLTASTGYYIHAVHETSVESDVFSSLVFTTDAGPTPITAKVNLYGIVGGGAILPTDDPDGHYWNSYLETINGTLTNLVDIDNNSTTWDIETVGFDDGGDYEGRRASDYQGIDLLAWRSALEKTSTSAVTTEIIISDLDPLKTYDIDIGASRQTSTGNRDTEYIAQYDDGSTTAITIDSELDPPVFADFNGLTPNDDGTIVFDVNRPEGLAYANWVRITENI